MRRREFITGLTLAVTLAHLQPPAARAQQDTQVRGLLNRILRMQAEEAAATISQFIHEIEVQMDWITAQPPSASNVVSWQVTGIQMMRRIPAITALSLIGTGREPGIMVKISRRADASETGRPNGSPDRKLVVSIDGVDAVGRSLIQSVQAMEKKAHYGPVYFRREREAYVTLTLLGTQGLVVGEINLTPIQDMLSRIKLSEHAQVNVIDAQGRLIFPDISLMLDNTNVTQFAQVRAARRAAAGAVGGPVQRTTDILGRELLTAYAPVEPLGWLLFVELPTDETNALAQ
jgi:hypothetical protein